MCRIHLLYFPFFLLVMQIKLFDIDFFHIENLLSMSSCQKPTYLTNTKLIDTKNS